jgi:ring-1,2-phenylacetyl-CoA epoxidase subunit PaaC
MHELHDANPAHEDGSVYDGLLGDPGQVDGHWAFGTSFEDPLAGVDTAVPDGVDAGDLAAYSLMLGDDALVHSHRLTEWCSNAPDLEEDIALANIALDLLGQARLLLARAAAADAAVVPPLPDGSPVPPEDALAFFRDETGFRNVRMVEAPNGDFAVTVVRLFLLSCWRLALLERLSGSTDQVLAAVAAKGVKEVTYHRDYAARWLVTLARGTDESRRRTERALAEVWPGVDELFAGHVVERRMADAGAGVDPSALRDVVDPVVDHVLATAGLERPRVPAMSGVRGRSGRDGLHTEALGHLLAEMQSVARTHPMGVW